MRDTLFIAKRLDNGEWVEGYLVKWIDPLTLIPKFYILTQEEDISGTTGEPTGWLKAEMCKYEVDPSTIGQYIGKTDKNGKKIFEGDILACITSDYDGSDKYVRYIITDITNFASMGFLEFCHELEVIGNINDNNELMNEQ